MPHTPQQNRVAERANRTLMEHIRALLKDQYCPLSFWGEAASTAAYCLNCTPTSVNGGVIAHEAFFGTVPDVSHLCTFYSNAYIHHAKARGAKKLGDRDPCQIRRLPRRCQRLQVLGPDHMYHEDLPLRPLPRQHPPFQIASAPSTCVPCPLHH